MADDPEKLLRKLRAELLAEKTRRLRAERRLEAAKAPAPVTRDELVETIALALCHDGHGRIAAERQVAHLEQSGFVVMKKPSLRPVRVPRRLTAEARQADVV